MSAKLRGSVTYRERVALPPGAVVRVRLEDVSRQDAAAEIVAETEIVTSGEQVPIPFALELDPPSLEPSRRYALRGSIEVGGGLRFATAEDHALPDDWAGAEVVLLVRGVPAATLVAEGGTRSRDSRRHRTPMPRRPLVESRRAVMDVARLAFAATAIAAMAFQLGVGWGAGRSVGNFFSFFTIQSNVLAVLALGALVVVRRSERTPLFDGLRTGAVLYIAITGVVFALLLSGMQEDLQTTTHWVDFVLHKLVPVVLVVDWLLDPPRHVLPWWTVAAWLAYPAAWLGYTLVRGEVVDWYPYPFVDVARIGYDGVALRAAVLAVGFALAASALLWLGNRRARGARAQHV
jgi:uncharacterized lipoprotein YbaY